MNMQKPTMLKKSIIALTAIAAFATVAQAQVYAVLVQYYPMNGYQMCVYQYPSGATFVRNVGLVYQSACPATW